MADPSNCLHVSCCVGICSNSTECKRMSSVTVLFQLEELKSATERTGAERFVSKTLPKMINPSRRHYRVQHRALVLCHWWQLFFFSVVAFISLLIIWKKRRKNVWIDEGDFPTLSRARKLLHCEQLPIPIALTLLFDSQYCYKRAACLSKRSLEEKLWVLSTIWPYPLKSETSDVEYEGYWTDVKTLQFVLKVTFLATIYKLSRVDAALIDRGCD